MSDNALIKRSDLAISFTPEAEQLVAQALESSALVAKVDSALTQEAAVDAQKCCRRVLKLVEDARKEVKAPVIAFGKAIDDAARKFVTTVAAEEMRVAKLVGDFQETELARARSAQAAKLAELTALEKAREEKLAGVKTLQEREQVHAEFSQLTQAVQVMPAAPVKAEGQAVEEVWCFEVENPHLLANAHPQYVTIEPKRREITEALKGGFKVQGIRAWKETRSRVRLEREPKAIAA
jgi:hypothetical protein